MTIEWRLEKIYTPEEQEERAAKSLGLLSLEGITSLDGTPIESVGFNLATATITEKLKAASSVKQKPTVRVDRLKAASKIKPTLRVNKVKKESLVDQLLRQRQAKLKAAASPHQVIVPPPSSVSSVQIAAALPTHDVTPDMVEPLADNQTELVSKTTCLSCGAKATQVLRFERDKEIPKYCRPSANPKILRGYCQICKGDLLARYSGSALNYM